MAAKADAEDVVLVDGIRFPDADERTGGGAGVEDEAGSVGMVEGSVGREVVEVRGRVEGRMMGVAPEVVGVGAFVVGAGAGVPSTAGVAFPVAFAVAFTLSPPVPIPVPAPVPAPPASPSRSAPITPHSIASFLCFRISSCTACATKGAASPPSPRSSQRRWAKCSGVRGERRSHSI